MLIIVLVIVALFSVDTACIGALVVRSIAKCQSVKFEYDILEKLKAKYALMYVFQLRR